MKSAAFICALALASSGSARAIRKARDVDAAKGYGGGSDASASGQDSWANVPAPTTSSYSSWVDTPAPSSSQSSWEDSPAPTTSSYSSWADAPAPSSTYNSWEDTSMPTYTSSSYSSWADAPAPSSTYSSWEDTPAPSSTYSSWEDTPAPSSTYSSWEDTPAPTSSQDSWSDAPAPSPSSAPSGSYTLYFNTQWSGGVQHYNRQSDANGAISVTLQQGDVLQSVEVKNPADNANCFVKDAQGNQIRAFGGPAQTQDSIKFEEADGKLAASISCELAK